MKKLEIGYVTDDPAKAYGKAIRAADSLEELIAAIEPYEVCADDALAQARGLDFNSFQEFKRDLPKAARTMPEDWVERFMSKFGAIVLPAKMMFASMLAYQYHAPWGTAFIRCEEEGWPMLKNKK